ncbi:interleukin-1 beta-like [Arapaima gigas]
MYFSSHLKKSEATKAEIQTAAENLHPQAVSEMCDNSVVLFKSLESMGLEEGDRALVQGGEDETFGKDLQADITLGGSPLSSTQQFSSLLDDMQSMTDKTWGTEFTDNELLQIMFENIVEQSAVVTMSSTKVGQFILTTSKTYNISDERQKNLVFIKETQELLAMSLQGGSVHKKVQLNLLVYSSVTLTKNTGQPTVLNIAGTNLYLCCRGIPEKPLLTVEEIQDPENLKTIKEGEDMMHFLFLKKNSDFSMCTFESAIFRGSFISTASDEKKPVEMSQSSTPGRHTGFKVYQK